MSLRNQNWTDLHGNPITGRAPPRLQVMNGVQPNPQQMGMIAHHYQLLTYMLKVSIIPYLVQERTLPDGTRIRMVSDHGVDTVMVWAAGGPPDEGEDLAQGWRALPSRTIWGETDWGATGLGWVRHKTTGALMLVVDADAPITAPGYEGTNPRVFIAAKSANVTLNSVHAAGGWYWSDHKKQQLLFTEEGVYYRQKLVNLYFDGAKVEGRAKGGGIAGAWILLVVGAKLYAVKKSSVLSAAGKQVNAVLIGDVPRWDGPEDLPDWTSPGYVRPPWRFSPGGLKAVAVENVVVDKRPVEPGLTEVGKIAVEAQTIHRLELTSRQDLGRPFDLEVTEEVPAEAVLNIQPRYEFSPNKIGEDFRFLRWEATSYAEFSYVFPFGFTAKTFNWSQGGAYLTPAAHNDLVQSLRDTQVKDPFPAPGAGDDAAILNPSPGMRSYVFERPPAPPGDPDAAYYRLFDAKFIDAQEQERYATRRGFTEAPSSYATSRNDPLEALSVGPTPPATSAWRYVPSIHGHLDFVAIPTWHPDSGWGDTQYSLKALAVGFIGKFGDTYDLVEDRRPLTEVLQEAKDLVAYYDDQSLPADMVAVGWRISLADQYVQQQLGSPSTLGAAIERAAYASTTPIRLEARPSSVIRYEESGATALGLYADGPTARDPDRTEPDARFWQRFYSEVSITIRPVPRYDLSKTVDYTAATVWVFSGRYIVDIDYGPEGQERELALVGDESRSVRYDVALRAVDVLSGMQLSESHAQRSLSGACSYTLQLDGDVVAERVVSASDTFSGFLWNEWPGDWADFRSGPWDNIWGERDLYGEYLGKTRSATEPFGQEANTECAGSMACQVSDQAFHLLDYDLRFKHVLLAHTAQTLKRTTQATAVNAVQRTGSRSIALWDNGELRRLGAETTFTSREWWRGAVPMLQSALYSDTALTRPATYLSGMEPAAYRYGANGSTPTNVTPQQYAAAVGALVAPLVEGLTLPDAAHFAPTMGVLPDYQALVRAGYAGRYRRAHDVGGVATYGRVLSYGTNVWLVVVNYDGATPHSFSVARAKSFNKPSDAQRLGQLLPFLQTVSAPNGALALPGFVT